MARTTSNSIMLPAVDRGASLRRPVVPGRSLPRTLFYLLVMAAMLAAAAYFYANRWQGERASAAAKVVQQAQTPQPVESVSQEHSFGVVIERKSLDENTLEHLDTALIDLAGTNVGNNSAISPDGQTLAICSRSGELAIVSFDGQERRSVALSAPVSVLAFSAKGAKLACGLSNGEVVLIDTKSANVIQKRRVHRAAVSSLSFHDDDRAILSAGGDGYLRTSSAFSLVERSRTSFGEPILAAVASSAQNLAWALGEDGTLRSYSLISMHELSTTFVAAGTVAIAVAEELGIVTLAKGELSVRDSTTLEVKWSQKGFDASASLSSHPRTVALSDGAGLFLVSSKNGVIVGRRFKMDSSIAGISLSKDLSQGLVIDREGHAHGLTTRS